MIIKQIASFVRSVLDDQITQRQSITNNFLSSRHKKYTVHRKMIKTSIENIFLLRKNRRCPKSQQVQSVECSNVGIREERGSFVF
jgi:hypothetical protein